MASTLGSLRQRLALRSASAQLPTHSGWLQAGTPSGQHFAFPWVVAPAEPAAPIAVLASNITWNAYNNFGGRSNYVNADQLPAAPIVNSRLELSRYVDAESHTWGHAGYAPLSFDRPEPLNDLRLEEKITDPIEGRLACCAAPAEWRTVGWLERQGFPYDLYAVQVHERQSVTLP